jgi:hypothetical protein
MTDEERTQQSSMNTWFIGVFGIMLLYGLAFIPLTWLAGHKLLSEKTVEFVKIIWAPIIYLSDHVPAVRHFYEFMVLLIF